MIMVILKTILMEKRGSMHMIMNGLMMEDSKKERLVIGLTKRKMKMVICYDC